MNSSCQHPRRQAHPGLADRHSVIWIATLTARHRRYGPPTTPVRPESGQARPTREQRTRHPVRDLGTRRRARSDSDPSLQIRRVCRGFFPPGHMPLGLRGYRSLLCVVTQSYAVLYGQNQTTDRAHGSEVLGHHAAGWAADCRAASGTVHSQLITCLQNRRKLSATVAHLGIRRRRVGRDRLVSDSVVVSLGGHRPFLLDKLIADRSMTLLLCSQ